MSAHYILDGKIVRRCDLMTWARWFETAHENRVVKQEEIAPDVSVSTVFLGLDHRFGGDGPPIVFETMVFGGPHDQEMERCCTWEEAEKQHADMVQRVKP